VPQALGTGQGELDDEDEDKDDDEEGEGEGEGEGDMGRKKVKIKPVSTAEMLLYECRRADRERERCLSTVSTETILLRVAA
jgi:hypothetical protein